MSATLIFIVPFNANLTWRDSQTLGNLLDLRIKRTDDWDDQVGSRLVGETGAIRLYRMDFRLDVPDWDHETQYYELRGIAVDTESQSLVANEYDRCYRAVREIGGIIDNDRILSSPGEQTA